MRRAERREQARNRANGLAAKSPGDRYVKQSRAVAGRSSQDGCDGHVTICGKDVGVELRVQRCAERQKELPPVYSRGLLRNVQH